MKKKYLTLAICTVMALSIAGCQNRMGRSNQGDTEPKISSIAQRSPNDFYVVIKKDGTTVRQGTYNNAPVISKLPAGTKVKVLDMQNGWYVTQLPNNNVGSIPMDSAEPEASEPAEQVPNIDGAPASSQTNEESSMLNLINSERSKAGLKPLSASEELNKIARLKSKDINDNNYFSHNSPTYGSPFDMLKKFGISYMYAGENLAKNKDVQSAHQALMASPEHKKNILNPNYTEVGIGVVSGGNGMNVYTQLFIGK